LDRRLEVRVVRLQSGRGRRTQSASSGKGADKGKGASSEGFFGGEWGGKERPHDNKREPISQKARKML